MHLSEFILKHLITSEINPRRFLQCLFFTRYCLLFNANLNYILVNK